MKMSSHSSSLPNLISLNVGGCVYLTRLSTLQREKSSLLGQYFCAAAAPAGKLDALISRLSDNTFFIDRDGKLFAYLLEYLRSGSLILPDNFSDYAKLRDEIQFYQLNSIYKAVKNDKLSKPYLFSTAESSLLNGTASCVVKGCHITLGYRGSFAFGRDGQADVKFRKMNRILVCGRVDVCREIFGDALNDSRDPDRGEVDRYTARLYLKHHSLELAFDTLVESGYRMVGCCASGTSGSCNLKRPSFSAEMEEQRWGHYNEYIFFRP